MSAPHSQPEGEQAKPFNAPPLDQEDWHRLLQFNAQLKKETGHCIIDDKVFRMLADYQSGHFIDGDNFAAGMVNGH